MFLSDRAIAAWAGAGNERLYGLLSCRLAHTAAHIWPAVSYIIVAMFPPGGATNLMKVEYPAAEAAIVARTTNVIWEQTLRPCHYRHRH